MTIDTEIIVIGGGAAGCMAALTAARKGASVILLERNQKLGRKLYITGKGRCNVTNDCAPDQVLQHIPRNGRFLTSAVTRFPPAAVQALFHHPGRAPQDRAGRPGLSPVRPGGGHHVDALLPGPAPGGGGHPPGAGPVGHPRRRRQGPAAVRTERGEHRCKAVILATGGVSYPLTGSTGDGYQMAAALGHTVVPPQASAWCPWWPRQDLCRPDAGAVPAQCGHQGPGQRQEAGDLPRARGDSCSPTFGLSGPLILSASAHMRRL